MEAIPQPRTLPWRWLLLAGALALWIDLGDYHDCQTADSLLPVLASLYRWTPFYWDQNRLGLLVPLLALPFKHPFVNLLVQTWLVLFATLGTLFLLPAYVLRGRVASCAGPLAAAFFFLLLTKDWSFYFSFGQLAYPVGLALGLAALRLLAGRGGWPSGVRLAAALVLSLLAHWVNGATLFALGPLVVCRRLLGRRGRVWDNLVLEMLLPLALLGTGAVVNGLLLRSLAPCVGDPVATGLLPLAQWPLSWWRLARGTWQAVVAPHAGWYAVLAALAALPLLVPGLRRGAAEELGAALALTVAAAVYAATMGALGWMAHNAYHCRYWIPAIFMLQAALAILVAVPLVRLAPAATGGWPRWLPEALCVAALLVGLAVHCGLPSAGRARAALDRLPHDVPLTQRTAEVLQTRASHIVGPYAQVWICVFHANLVLHEHGSDRVVWGVTGRSVPTWDLWGHAALDDLRVAVLPARPEEEWEAEYYLRRFFPPLTEVQRRPTLSLRRPTQIVRLAQPPAADSEAVTMAWHPGFCRLPVGSVESGAEWLWGTSSAALDIVNASCRPRTVTWSMDVVTVSGRPARLFLDGPLLTDAFPVAAAPHRYTRTLTVPPGRHVVALACDGPAVALPWMWGARFTFVATNFRLTERPRGAEPTASDFADPQ
jgi:hypothetical protein